MDYDSLRRVGCTLDFFSDIFKSARMLDDYVFVIDGYAVDLLKEIGGFANWPSVCDFYSLRLGVGEGWQEGEGDREAEEGAGW